MVAELMAGAYRSDNPEKWLRRFEEQVFPRISILDFDAESAHHYGRLKAALFGRGEPIGDLDMMIAACALRFGLPVVTANVGHFERIPSLKVIAFEPGERGRLLL